MRWIVKLRDAQNHLKYWDGEAPTEANAAAKALEAHPNYWLVRAWPISDAEYAAIIKGGENVKG